MKLSKQIHDGLLVHASDANTSQRRRCGFVIRYVPTCAYPIQVRGTFLMVCLQFGIVRLALCIDLVGLFA